jgi:hypothetical protein
VRGRSTGELLVLLVAGTVCASVLLGGGTVAIVKIVHPEADVTQATSIIADVINTLIGLLAGFLAGKTDLSVRPEGRPSEDTDIEPIPRRPL